jgi:hypothetical protein
LAAKIEGLMNSVSPEPLVNRLDGLRRRAHTFFDHAGSAVSPRQQHFSAPDYWEELHPELQGDAMSLSDDIVALARDTALSIRRSPLLTEADQLEAGHAIKGMRAAVRLRRYEYWNPEILHDEGTVLGVKPGGDSDEYRLHPAEAALVFDKLAQSLRDRLALTGFGEGAEVAPVNQPRPIAAGYRPGSAFIMMWMSDDHPELEDVSNTVKRCFDEFGIVAVRSDDIEHEEVITQRILDEIKTAEFLFADLSGERPSVYYEVGYAQALGRRVILFRKSDTTIHFDLAAYNCPEYQNLAELETKLRKRLEHVTGKPARGAGRTVPSRKRI